MAKITVLSEANTRTITTKAGTQKLVHSQQVQLETETMRIRIDLDIESPGAAKPVGSVWDWDVEADLIPGRFGPEISRNLTLKPAAKAAQVKAA